MEIYILMSEGSGMEVYETLGSVLVVLFQVRACGEQVQQHSLCYLWGDGWAESGRWRYNLKWCVGSIMLKETLGGLTEMILQVEIDLGSCTLVISTWNLTMKKPRAAVGSPPYVDTWDRQARSRTQVWTRSSIYPSPTNRPRNTRTT